MSESGGIEGHRSKQMQNVDATPPHPSMVTSVGSSLISWALECLHTSQLLASQEASPRREGHAEQFKTQPAFATLGFLQPPFLSHWETRGSNCPYHVSGPNQELWGSHGPTWAKEGNRKGPRSPNRVGFWGVIPNVVSQMWRKSKCLPSL